MAQQSFNEARYSSAVWAGTAAAAILAVSAGASLWVFFGQTPSHAFERPPVQAPIQAGLLP
jgi:hypothetical protein